MPTNPSRPDIDRFFAFLNRRPQSTDLPPLLDLFTDPDRGLVRGGSTVAEWSATSVNPGDKVKRPPNVAFRGMATTVTVTIPVDTPPTDTVPYPYTFGELLIALAWQAGYSPRLYDRPPDPTSDDGLPALLAFVPFPDPPTASAPVSTAILHSSARVGALETPTGSKPRGLPLRQWIDIFDDKYGVGIRATASLLDQPVFLAFAASVSLAYVLDAVALYLHATWDWSEDGALLRAGGCKGLCIDRYANR